MAVRSTGFAMLFGNDPQQAHDLALDVAATLLRRREKSPAALWGEAVVRERRNEHARAAERYLALCTLARRASEEFDAKKRELLDESDDLLLLPQDRRLRRRHAGRAPPADAGQRGPGCGRTGRTNRPSTSGHSPAASATGASTSDLNGAASVRSTMRSTPWVEGCCGPMLRVIIR